MLNERQIITEIRGNVSALPAGIVKHPNPLSNHHYILTSDNIAPASEVIFDVLQDRIARKTPDKPFIAAFFEEHATISHILLRADMLRRFAEHQEKAPDDKARKFMYADEIEYNWLYSLTSQTVPRENKYRPDIYDPNNQILTAKLTSLTLPYAPISNNILFKICLENGIKTCFNDVPTIEGEGVDYLDPNDPNIKETTNVNLSDGLIDCESEGGMEARNDFMAHNVLVEAAHSGIDAIIQGMGFGHGGIKANKNLPYGKSYLKKCRDKGAEVTSIFLSRSRYSTAENIIPEQALKDDPDMIVIDKMPEYKGFRTNSYEEIASIQSLMNRHSDGHFITTNEELVKARIDEILSEYDLT